jgi:hypothetical protein
VIAPAKLAPSLIVAVGAVAAEFVIDFSIGVPRQTLAEMTPVFSRVPWLNTSVFLGLVFAIAWLAFSIAELRRPAIAWYWFLLPGAVFACLPLFYAPNCERSSECPKNMLMAFAIQFLCLYLVCILLGRLSNRWAKATSNDSVDR